MKEILLLVDGEWGSYLRPVRLPRIPAVGETVTLGWRELDEDRTAMKDGMELTAEVVSAGYDSDFNLPILFSDLANDPFEIGLEELRFMLDCAFMPMSNTTRIRIGEETA